MKPTALIKFLVAASVLAPALAGLPAHAQGSFPSRQVTLVVPYAPGGGHDAMARIVAERLTARVGQNVIVENKPGANGMLGAEFVSRAAPDGHTLLFASPAEIVISPIAYKSMRYDPARDLAPVTLAGMTPLVVVAHPGTGVRSIPELVALARAQPGKMSFGTAGNASSQHLAGALLNNLAGIDLQHIPYKGAGPATNDVLGGQIPFAIVGMAPVLGHIRAGKLVPLAVTQSRRPTWAPDLPTVAESPGLAGFEATHWMGVLAPARTPPEVVQKLQSEIAAVLAVPEVRTRLLGMGIEPVANTPGEFRDFLAADRERFARMFKLTGLVAE
jgi:tripartite-type tricarboxylate transporter receptor subunit TctC